MRFEERLRAISITDELTGLFNRRGFFKLSRRQHQLIDRVDGSLFLLFADIDNMKWINDTLGHHMGDQALVEVAGLLKSTFRLADVIGRLGGDEFAVLLTDKSDVTSIDSATSRLEDALQKINEQHNRAFPLALSYGVIRYDPEAPCSLEELLSGADRLMYQNKNKKKRKRRP
jgi:diguanylate cyclase (GGDEF)-like protein